MSLSNIIRTKNLTKRFGNFIAVDSVSLTVHTGEVLGYLGPNGSGKTTTIRMLMGLLLPSSGSAEVLGKNIKINPEQIRAQCGYMSQKFALYDELTAWENLAFYAGVYGVYQKTHIKNALERLGLKGIEKERAGELPVGWRQRLALATAIVHQPKLLFLDEPTSGVDPTARRDFWDLIYEFIEEGMTAFVTTHYMDEAEYCKRVGIMSNGQLLAIDTPLKLKEEYLPGIAWDIWVEPLLPAIVWLEKQPGILRTGLASAHIRVITEKTFRKEDLILALQQITNKTVEISRAEPSLEDVFLSLADNKDSRLNSLTTDDH